MITTSSSATRIVCRIRLAKKLACGNGVPSICLRIPPSRLEVVLIAVLLKQAVITRARR